MKRIFLPLVMVALSGLAQASSTSADYVQVVPKLKANETKVEQVTPPGQYFASKDTEKNINPAWHYVRLPYELQGKCRDAKDLPLYVDELKVHAYLVFSVGKKGDKLILLDKEVTYVNIPLSPKTSEKMSKNENVQAAVFISPSDAARICADDAKKTEKVDLESKLGAVAVEFRFNGADCVKPESEVDVLVNKKLKSRLKKNWWKKEDKNGIGVQLRAICNTPFAPFYAPAFPPTSPLFGDDAVGSTSTSSYSGSTGGASEGYTPAATDDSTEPAASSEEEEPAPTTKKSKKRRK